MKLTKGKKKKKENLSKAQREKGQLRNSFPNVNVVPLPVNQRHRLKLSEKDFRGKWRAQLFEVASLKELSNKKETSKKPKGTRKVEATEF